MKKNENITDLKLILIDENGENCGEKDLEEALSIASEKKLDLVQVREDPSVCKLMDSGKISYNKKKKNKKNKQSVIKKKEMRFSFNTDIHDIRRKAKRISKWLSDGMKVRINMKVPIRKTSDKDIVKSIFDKMLVEIETPYSIIQEVNIGEKNCSAEITKSKKG